MAGPWTAAWQANTAYLTGAVVIPTASSPTSFGDFTWRCTTPGTSAGSEPAWPDPSVSSTVNDGSVVWSVGTGFRQALSAGLLGTIATFAQANPTIIRSVFPARPRSFVTVELPCFFVGDLNEIIATSQGVRQRRFTGFSAYLVDDLGEQEESRPRMNFAADVLADVFTAAYHAAGGRALLQHSGTLDIEFNESGVVFPALQFLFAESVIAEGRT